MKRFYGLFVSLFFAVYSFADYTGVITTNISELTFGEQEGYDVLTLPNGEYTSIVGYPQLPVKTFTYLIPADVSVSGITITSNSVVQLNGIYNILPIQEHIPTNVNHAGRLVLSEEIKGNNTSINISSLKQGVYMYRIINGENIIARDRIVKE